MAIVDEQPPAAASSTVLIRGVVGVWGAVLDARGCCRR